MARFVPAKLAGVSPHTRMVYPGKLMAVYQADGGYVNLDVGGLVSTIARCSYRFCKKRLRVKAHRFCSNAAPDRYALGVVLGERIQLTLSGPKRKTLLKMLRAIDLKGLAGLARTK